MKPILVTFLLIVFLLLSGCADIKMPTMQYAYTHPLSTKTMVRKGASKEEIAWKWGEPSEIKELGYDEAGLKKEAWIYNAWFPYAPVDYRYLSRKKCIYFTGDCVTGFEDMELSNGSNK